jgi:hypothetical protein
MIKKEYMTPEIEEIELEMSSNVLLDTSNGENENENIEDL